MKPGTFIIYAPPQGWREDRLEAVRRAVRRIAKTLGAGVRVIRTPAAHTVYVFYRNGRAEDVPIYYDRDGRRGEEEVYRTAWSVVFALSFHPAYPALQRIQEGLRWRS